LDVEGWKRAAAEAAAKLAQDGMVVGLGSGSTVTEIVRALAKVKPKSTFVPASSSTERLATELGLKMGSLDDYNKFDLVLDGADEVGPDFNLIKGRGGAHTREKILARGAKRLVIVVDKTKLVQKLGERSPVPVEILPFIRDKSLGFAHKHVMEKLAELGGKPKLRVEKDGVPFVTDNGNYILDVNFGVISDPAKLERDLGYLSQIGVVENGLFINLTDEVLVGYDGGCKRLRSKKDFLKFMPKERNKA
jgi:ribose 5-phosphate isomerase A